MGIAKRVVDKVKEVVKPKTVKVNKVEEVKITCSNCDGSTQCSVCSPVFRDTFGE